MVPIVVVDAVVVPYLIVAGQDGDIVSVAVVAAVAEADGVVPELAGNAGGPVIVMSGVRVHVNVSHTCRSGMVAAGCRTMGAGRTGVVLASRAGVMLA